MEVIKSHLPEGHPNRPGVKLSTLKAIVIHYTQNDSPGATDTMNVKYIGRTWETGKYWSKTKKKVITGPIEKGSLGKGEQGLGIPFRYGSAHVFCDMDSVTEAIPLDEAAWGCGDKNYKGGYQEISEKVFKFHQNFETISVEICNNDVIKNSDEDWKAAVANAKEWVLTFLNSYNYKIDKEGSLKPQLVSEPPPSGTLLLLRHYDITGKNCPAPFIDNPNEWKYFVEDIAGWVSSDGKA